MLPIPFILVMYIISHLGIPMLAVYLFVAFAPVADAAPLGRPTLSRYSAYSSPSYRDTRDRAILTTWPQAPTDILVLPADAEKEADDWSKWHSEQDIQQDIRRKLECRSVEFGSCDVQRARRSVTVVLESGNVEGDGE